MSRRVIVPLLRLDAVNGSVCMSCRQKLLRHGATSRRTLSHATTRRESITAKVPAAFDISSRQSSGRLKSWDDFFFPSAIRRAASQQFPTHPVVAASRAPEPSPTVLPEASISEATPPIKPRIRRRRLPVEVPSEHEIPLDASARLSKFSSSLPRTSYRRQLAAYLALSKPRLSFLIVLTTTASYSLYPTPALLSTTATAAPSLSPLTLLFLTTGTALACSSANALNMLFEPSYDAKMSRTRNRPLVRGLISKKGALFFAVATAILGVGGLYVGVNPTVAGLGALNIGIYAFAYTPLKRISVINTWVGAVVGAIPPLMGWAAAAGQYSTSGGNSGEWKELLFANDGSSTGGWLLAGLLFAWQFPHFNALSWTIREEYKAAGYRMLAWANTRMNGRVALRYALLMFPICFGLTAVGVTDQAFLVTSTAVNAWMAHAAYRFWRNDGLKGSARGLFWASVWQLPLVLVLAMAQKKGLWERIWRSAFGNPEEELDEDLYEDIDAAEETQQQPLVLSGR